MTKKILISAIAASVMATSAMATNGASMISYGAKDKAMGGTGIASANGAQSGIMNPAMIAGAEQEVSVNATYMMIDVTASRDGATAISSATDTSVVPTIAYVRPINKDITVGFNVYGAAGMGTDYSAESTLFNMTSSLQILKVAVPVAYKMGAATVGFTPVFASGSLEMAYTAMAPFAADNTDTAFSYELGAAYAINKDITVGAVYKAPISLTYDGVLNSTDGAASGFMVAGITDELEQPAEMGLGVTYKIGKSTINVDYKTIAWSSAAGYGDFGWDDQAVIGLGYEFNGGTWTARAGYSMSNTPLTDHATTNAIDALNATGFPAAIASHITFGGSYTINKAMTVEGAVVLAAGEEYAPESAIAGFAVASMSATNDQTNITLGLNYKF